MYVGSNPTGFSPIIVTLYTPLLMGWAAGLQNLLTWVQFPPVCLMYWLDDPIECRRIVECLKKGEVVLSLVEATLELKERTKCPYELFFCIHNDFLVVSPSDKAIGAAIKENVSEPFEFYHMRRILKRNQMVLDAGSCIGDYALEMCRIVGPYGRVLAVEPDPVNFEILRFNLRLNGFHWAETYNVALGAEPKTINMGKGIENVGDNTAGYIGNRETFPTRLCRLDDLTCGRVIDFAKIDVQGMETDVFSGGKTVLSASKGCLVEYCPDCLRKCGSSRQQFADEIFSIYTRVGMIAFTDVNYQIQWISKDNLIKMTGLTEDFYVNLWCDS